MIDSFVFEQARPYPLIPRTRLSEDIGLADFPYESYTRIVHGPVPLRSGLNSRSQRTLQPDTSPVRHTHSDGERVRYRVVLLSKAVANADCSPNLPQLVQESGPTDQRTQDVLVQTQKKGLG